jgi:hypothetical protein
LEVWQAQRVLCDGQVVRSCWARKTPSKWPDSKLMPSTKVTSPLGSTDCGIANAGSTDKT